MPDHTHLATLCPSSFAIYVDARWYTRDEVLAVLAHPHGTKMGNRDPSKPDPQSQSQPQSTAGNLAGDAPKNNVKAADTTAASAVSQPDEPPFRLPPITAIAGVLIHDWAHYKVAIRGTKDAKTWRGSL